MFFMQTSGIQVAHNGHTRVHFNKYVMRYRVFSLGLLLAGV
jgi:hypothetical protein